MDEPASLSRHADKRPTANDEVAYERNGEFFERAVAVLLVSPGTTEHRRCTRKTGGLAPFRLRRVLDFMDAHIDTRIDIQDLAMCAGLSVSHFAHQFRQSTGVSPHRYRLQLRVDRAKALLENSGMSVLQIALAVGFDNQQHFATVFRRLEGVSPSAYRRSTAL